MHLFPCQDEANTQRRQSQDTFRDMELGLLVSVSAEACTASEIHNPNRVSYFLSVYVVVGFSESCSQNYSTQHNTLPSDEFFGILIS